MKAWLLVIFVALAATQTPPPGFPTLLQTCTWSGTVYRGDYNDSALFLSAQSRAIATPELLFDYVDGGGLPRFLLGTSGFDTAIAFPFLDTPLNRISLQNATNSRTGEPGFFSCPVGGSFAIWTFHQQVQAIWAVHVDSFDGTTVKLSYSVYYYQVVSKSTYNLGKYDDHPTNTCNAPDPLPTPLQTCRVKLSENGTVLFLSTDSKETNTPELIPNSLEQDQQGWIVGAGGLSLGASVALGTAPLSTVNYYNITRPPNDFLVPQTVQTKIGNTYGVWTFGQRYQALWAFSVDACMDNRCSISFTVVYYQVVTRSDYVIADYVAFPKPVCTAA